MTFVFKTWTRRFVAHLGLQLCLPLWPTTAPVRDSRASIGKPIDTRRLRRRGVPRRGMSSHRLLTLFRELPEAGIAASFSVPRRETVPKACARVAPASRYISSQDVITIRLARKLFRWALSSHQRVAPLVDEVRITKTQSPSCKLLACLPLQFVCRLKPQSKQANR